MAKQKFYVVWKGVNPGIYSSWTDCQLQIQGYKGAIYKSFDSQEEAEHAFATPAYQYMNRHRASSSEKTEVQLPENFNLNCLAVDAACSGNPGPMEYRGVYLLTDRKSSISDRFTEPTISENSWPSFTDWHFLNKRT